MEPQAIPTMYLMANNSAIDDNEICDLSDDIRGLVVRALGEDDIPPSHPLAKRARRELAAVRDALRTIREGK